MDTAAIRGGSLRSVLSSEVRLWLPLAVLVFFVASILMSGWPTGLKPNIEYPFTYVGDGLSHSRVIQRLLEGYWHFDNERSGYPFGSNFLDYPDSDGGNYLVIKFLGWIFGPYSAVLNIYFLLGFSVTFAVSYAVLRAMNVSRYFAAAAAVVFVFLPFHILRIQHLFYTWYFVVPLFFYYSYRLFVAKHVFGEVENRWKCIFKHSVVFLSLASFGVYYAAFGVIVLTVGAIAGSIRNNAKHNLLIGIGASAIVALGVLVNVAPNIYHAAVHGRNFAAVSRAPADSEIYGLKLAQMLLPRPGHRVDYLASKTYFYNNTFPLVSENMGSSLGLVGSAGLLLLLCLSFMGLAGRQVESRLAFLGLATLALSLIAVVGGFASIFAMFISPLIRAWNRTSIFIGFASITSVFIFLELVLRRKLSEGRLARGIIPIAVGMSMFGVWDQTTSPCTSCNEAVRSKFASDREFVKRIEAVVPRGSAMYQLPYMAFPEVPPSHHLQGYGLTIGFLHSTSLRWNYGGIKGREGDLFFRGLAQEDVKRQIDVIRKLGFAGIYVDRRGLKDDGRAIEGELRKTLGAGPELTSADGQLAFYRIAIGAPLIAVGTEPDEIMTRAGFSVDKYGPYSGLRKDYIKPTATRPTSVPSSVASADSCNIDSVNDGPRTEPIVITDKAKIKLSGWAGNITAGTSPQEIYIELEGPSKIYIKALHSFDRPDVATYFNKPGLTNSGWESYADLAGVAAGTYKVRIIQVDGQFGLICGNGSIAIN